MWFIYSHSTCDPRICPIKISFYSHYSSFNALIYGEDKIESIMGFNKNMIDRKISIRTDIASRN